MRKTFKNPNKLVAFYILAREGNNILAAEQLCVSPSAVIREIKTLERAIGSKLIYDRRRPVTLTEAGKTLLPYAEVVYHSLAKAEKFIEDYSEPVLRLGVSADLTICLAPIIERFIDTYDNCRVRLREGLSMRMVGELLDDKHDLCVVAWQGTFHDKLSVLQLIRAREITVVASPKHPLARRLSLQWRDIGKYPLILHQEGSMARKVVLDELSLRNIDPLIVGEINSTQCMKRLIIEGKGVAPMFLPNVRNELNLNKLVKLPLTEDTRRLAVAIVCRRGAYLSPPSKKFLSLAKKYLTLDADSSSDPPSSKSTSDRMSATLNMFNNSLQML
ncbi:MAG: HTH-type transcriptional regulator GltC [Syntrophorhabdus sp. PtaU1.Bin153]|nr:MAG: HTH-type transcriptional regulator GltC [Syntrophorhabdus sp. PtaU1.Bin153]